MLPGEEGPTHPREGEFGVVPFPPDEDFLPPSSIAGLIIGEVMPDSPADEAGLREGDVILLLDGEPVTFPAEFREAIAGRSPGDRIELTVLRRDTQDVSEIRVRLGEHPDFPGHGYLGLRVGFYLRHQEEAPGPRGP